MKKGKVLRKGGPDRSESRLTLASSEGIACFLPCFYLVRGKCLSSEKAMC